MRSVVELFAETMMSEEQERSIKAEYELPVFRNGQLIKFVFEVDQAIAESQGVAVETLAKTGLVVALPGADLQSNLGVTDFLIVRDNSELQAEWVSIKNLISQGLIKIWIQE